MRPLCLILLVLPAWLTAQDPRLSAPSQLHLAAGVATDDHGQPLAIGRDYRATFVDGGVRFEPTLGAHIPARLDWTFQLQSITRGEWVGITAGEAVLRPRTWDERQVRFAHAGIVERYDARPEGLEQSFVFAERPSGQGDLVVRGTVATPLPNQAGDDGGWRFVDPRSGGVTVGAVTGIAADGRRCRGEVSFAAGVLELRLPGEFVAQAAYPLVLDPLIGTAAVVSSATPESAADIAFDATAGIYLAVWCRGIPGFGSTIYGQRLSSSGALVGPPIAVVIPGVTTGPSVSVGVIDSQDRFVVAWSEVISGGASEVRCRTVSTSGIMTAAMLLSVPGTLTNFTPVVSGSVGSFWSDAIVAWRDDAVGIRSRTVNYLTSTGMTLGPTQLLMPMTSNPVTGPNITKTRNGAGMTVVTAEVSTAFGNTMHARAVDQSGPRGATIFPVLAFGGSVHQAIDTNGTDFLLVYTKGNIMQAPLQWNGTALVFGVIQPLVNAVTAIDLAIGWLGERYVVLWTDVTASTTPIVRGITVKQYGSACCPVFSPVPVLVANQYAPAIATAAQAGGLLNDTGMLLWSEQVSNLVRSVCGQRFEAMVGVPPVQLSPACPSGGTLATNGPFALGNETFTFRLSGGDPTAPLAVLGLSVGNLPTIPCGCAFQQSLVTMAAPATAGSADMVFVVPCNPSLPGFQLEAQFVLLGGTASPCSAVPGLTGSNRLQLTVAL